MSKVLTNARVQRRSGVISLHTHVSCGVIAMLCCIVRCAFKIGKLNVYVVVVCSNVGSSDEVRYILECVIVLSHL